MERLRRWPQLATLFVLALALAYLAWLGWGLLPKEEVAKSGFDGDQALAIAQTLCDIGPRPAGSPEGWQTGGLILQELQDMGWRTAVGEFLDGDRQLRNITAIAGKSDGPLLVVATHYDTRIISDRDVDPARRDLPSPGANDGASGVAVLLELARALDVTQLQHRVWLVFLDGEANAGAPGWEGQLGSKDFVDGRHPAAVIYLNMVGAADARFPQSPDASDLLQTQLWKQADKLGYDAQFISETGPTIEDAHTVFLQAGIPAAEIIQPDYRYARTTQDTCDKLDAATLKSVGVLLESYLENNDFLTIAPSLKK